MTVAAVLDNDGNLVVETPVYGALFARGLGYAGREITITAGGAQRLDRFDRLGAGQVPTCMCFENLVVNNASQQGFYPKVNTGVEARIIEADAEQATVELTGALVPIRDDTPSEVQFRKHITFRDDSYLVDLTVEPPDAPLTYIGIWWDVNDRWLTHMRSSAGVLLPLRPRYADASGELTRLNFKTFQEMDRGEGVWMEVVGPLEALHVRLVEPEDLSGVRGGMKFFDGPDEDESSPGASHACINLDLFTDWAPTEWAPKEVGPVPEHPHYVYEVQLIPAVTYRV